MRADPAQAIRLVWVTICLTACVAVRPNLPPPAVSTSTPALAPSASPLPHASPSTLPTQTAPLEGALTPQFSTPSASPSTLPAPQGPSAAVPTLGPTTPGRIENFEPIGRNALGSRGWNAGLALAYPCAYVGNRNLPQIAILDVSDPANPVLANELFVAPGARPIELRAVPDLNLLVVLNESATLSLIAYDVSDCLRPQPIGSLGLGNAPHEFFLWRDPANPRRLLLYAAMFGGGADLHVVDLADPTNPRRIATWSAAGEGAAGPLHSLSLARDGTRAYLALWNGGFLVADASDFAAEITNPQLRLIRDSSGFTPVPGANVHSAVLLADGRHVLLTQEVYDCPFAGLMIADIANEARPAIVGRFDLPENTACDRLPQPDAVFTSHNPLVVGDIAFVTWYGGGLQALDLSRPEQPARGGLFVPSGEGAAPISYVGSYPVQLWSYPILRQGLMYVSDIQSGLYVLRYTGPGSEAVGRAPLAEGNVTVVEDEP